MKEMFFALTCKLVCTIFRMPHLIIRCDDSGENVVGVCMTSDDEYANKLMDIE